HLGDALADAAGGAGDECDLVFYAHGFLLGLVFSLPALRFSHPPPGRATCGTNACVPCRPPWPVCRRCRRLVATDATDRRARTVRAPRAVAGRNRCQPHSAHPPPQPRRARLRLRPVPRPPRRPARAGAARGCATRARCPARRRRTSAFAPPVRSGGRAVDRGRRRNPRTGSAVPERLRRVRAAAV